MGSFSGSRRSRDAVRGWSPEEEGVGSDGLRVVEGVQGESGTGGGGRGVVWKRECVKPRAMEGSAENEGSDALGLVDSENRGRGRLACLCLFGRFDRARFGLNKKGSSSTTVDVLSPLPLSLNLLRSVVSLAPQRSHPTALPGSPLSPSSYPSGPPVTMSDPIVEKEAGPPALADSPAEPASNGSSEDAVPEKRKREYKDFGHDKVEATRMSFFSFFRPAKIYTSPPQMPMWTCRKYVFVSTSSPKFVCSCHPALQIELKAEDLYDKEKVDLETIIIEDVFKLLQCDDNGLTGEEAARRLDIFGPNKLESEEQNPFFQVGLHLYV